VLVASGPGGEARVVAALDAIRAERTRLRERLLVSDRLASIATLAAGVAHEINNPLAVALGNVEYALATVAGLERGAVTALATDLREPLVDAREALSRIRDIVRDVRLFSRSGDRQRRGPVDVRAVLRSAIRLTWNEVRHRARLVEELGEVPSVDGNDSRLGQVFLNALVNAIQALPEGRAAEHRITVRTSTDAGRAVVEIADTGCGIAAEHLPRVFEPFFTTKPVEVGAGLGLAICHAIVTEHGGSIDVDSELGVGTRIRIILPPGAAAALAQAPPRSGATGARSRVLVIDDEPMLGTVMQRALAPEYDVTLTTSSRDALAAMEQGGFDVVLCDLMMPDVDGLTLYRMVAPDLRRKFVFVTGGPFSPEVQRFFDEVPGRRLDKPFEPEQLRAIVRAALRPAGAT
jgi:nitrogen-specific signal transduction histidine kinase/CheY-like chemotaxis protein